MRVFLGITIALLCAVSALAQDTKIQEATAVKFQELLAKQVPVYVTGPSLTRYETTDGSAQIGRIISELEPGWVLFGPCTGEAVKEQRENLRETKVPCDEEPDSPPGRIWSAKCSTAKSEILTRAMVDASMGNAVGGEIYRSIGQDNLEVRQLDKSMSGWMTVGNVDCLDEKIFEIQYLSPTEAMSWGKATGVDVSKGLMALYPSER